MDYRKDRTFSRTDGFKFYKNDENNPESKQLLLFFKKTAFLLSIKKLSNFNEIMGMGVTCLSVVKYYIT